MAKTGIGALIFMLIFGVIFAISAYMFFSVLSGLDIAELGIFAGLGAALGGIALLFSGVVGGISGFLTIMLLILAIDRIKTYRRQKKFQK
jgi:hypothetical protein